jgi:hypothetical protein
MPLTPSDRITPIDVYKDYRRSKAAMSGPSARMTTRINLLEAQLATRARIQPEQLRNKNVVTQIKLQKASQVFEDREKATSALKSFLEGRKAPALELKDELELLGRYILSIGPQGTYVPAPKYLPGPLKKVEKAMSKTVVDYDGLWTQNKDLVRGTLACRTNEHLSIIANLMLQTCTTEFGMFLIKRDQQSSTRDGGKSKSGYSGWNFVVQFKEHRSFGAELQANTFDLLYGKHSKKEFLDMLKFSEPEYNELKNRLKFPGGLGHALYDMQDVGRSHTDAKEAEVAQVLCLDYNDACRGSFKCTTLDELNRRISEFKDRLTSAVAKHLWEHAVKGCGWTGYPIA